MSRKKLIISTNFNTLLNNMNKYFPLQIKQLKLEWWCQESQINEPNIFS